MKPTKEYKSSHLHKGFVACNNSELNLSSVWSKGPHDFLLVKSGSLPVERQVLALELLSSAEHNGVSFLRHYLKS